MRTGHFDLIGIIIDSEWCFFFSFQKKTFIVVLKFKVVLLLLQRQESSLPASIFYLPSFLSSSEISLLRDVVMSWWKIPTPLPHFFATPWGRHPFLCIVRSHVKCKGGSPHGGGARHRVFDLLRTWGPFWPNFFELMARWLWQNCCGWWMPSECKNRSQDGAAKVVENPWAHGKKKKPHLPSNQPKRKAEGACRGNLLRVTKFSLLMEFLWSREGGRILLFF